MANQLVFSSILYSMTKFEIYHLSFSFTTQDAFNIADPRSIRVRNCDQLVANASENRVLATRISRLVPSRRLTFSVVSTQALKSKNFAFDFNKKLNPCLVESAHCNRNLVAAMFSANENHRRRETGTNNFVQKWPGTSNMATFSCVAS